MKQLSNLLMIFTITAGLAFLQSCEKEVILPDDAAGTLADAELKKADKLRTFYGPTTSIGKGVARAWVKEDASGNPVEVGVDITEKVLESLPKDHASFVLPFHKNKGKNFYDHVLLGWEPMGHEPPGVYDVPHFDVHFYITSSAEREAIGFAPVSDPVDSDYVPDYYFLMDPVIPQMGSHWADGLSPEVSDDPDIYREFTHVMILGSYKGEFTFWEPMVTLDFLLQRPNVKVPVRQPKAWQRDGWYAKSYKIYYSSNPGTYTIALSELTWRKGS